MTAAAIIIEIRDGNLDGDLDNIARAIESRREQKVYGAGIYPGMIVKFTAKMAGWKPDYVGKTGRLERVNKKTVTVTHIEGDTRGVRVPHDWIESV